jgi:sugar phosphate permease
MEAFHIGAQGLGTLSGIFFYFYVAMQVPTGVLVDSLGPRKLLIWGGLAGAVGTLLFGITDSFVLACIGRAITGAATALEWLVLLKLGAHWFPARRFSMLAGLGLFFGNLGALTAQVPLRLLINMFGWRILLVCSAAVLVLLSALSYWIVRDDPSDVGMKSFAAPEHADAKNTKTSELWKGFVRIFRHRNMWLVFFSQGGFVGPMIAFTGLWAAPFLTVRFGLKTTTAAAVASIMIIAWAVACPICGSLSDKLALRKPIYIVGALISCIGWTVMFRAQGLSLAAFVVVATITSFSCGAVIIGFAYCRESVSPRYFGASNAVVNIGNMMGAAILQPAIGWVLDRHWSGQFAGGVRVYSLSALQAGCLLIPAWACLSFILLCFTKETHGKQIA